MSESTMPSIARLSSHARLAAACCLITVFGNNAELQKSGAAAEPQSVRSAPAVLVSRTQADRKDVDQPLPANAEPANAEPAKNPTLRILSYNIHHAEGVDGQLDVKRIAAVIRSCQPDIVSLQEVDRLVERTANIDQPAELARLTDMHVAFGGNITLQGGHYGNAILSRWPIRSHQNHLLPCHDQGEQRGVLAATIPLNDSTDLLFLATHFDHRRPDAERQASAEFINQQFASAPVIPSILAGDLNDTIHSRPLQTLQQQWSTTSATPQPTIPVASPTRQIDFILFRPADHWTVLESRVLDEAVASDHRAILAVLEYAPRKLPVSEPRAE